MLCCVFFVTWSVFVCKCDGWWECFNSVLRRHFVAEYGFLFTAINKIVLSRFFVSVLFLKIEAINVEIIIRMWK